MSILSLAVILIGLAIAAYYVGRRQAVSRAGGSAKDLHSRPGYYGTYAALWSAIPAFLLMATWLAVSPSIIENQVVSSLPEDVQALPENERGLILNDIRNFATGNAVSTTADQKIIDAAAYYNSLRASSSNILSGLAIVVALGGMGLAWRFIHPHLRARNAVEKMVMVFLIGASTIAIFTTAGIVLSLLFEASRFFAQVPFWEFLFGLEWRPQIALRADQVGSSGAFGAVPIFLGTFLISAIAMTVAVPIGLMSAIYMAEYASPKMRSIVKPALEILAGIPTVVYGFFAALTVAPAIRGFGDSLGLDVSSESALAAGIVMGIMIIPFVSSLSDDVISAVPRSLREGSYGLGATKSETIKRVILPAALPGIVGSILLAVSRAIGETMIVVMAAGLAANLTVNPFQAVTTVTVQIVTLLIGDQEFDSPKTLAAFALGLVLFFVTLGLNVIALHVVRKYREQYD